MGLLQVIQDGIPQLVSTVHSLVLPRAHCRVPGACLFSPIEMPFCWSLICDYRQDVREVKLT